MASNIDVEVTGDPERFNQAMKKSERRIDTLERKLREVRRTSRRTTDDTAKGFGNVQTKLTGVVASVASFGAASQVFRRFVDLAKEYNQQLDEIIQKQDKLGGGVGVRGLALANPDDPRTAINETEQATNRALRLGARKGFGQTPEEQQQVATTVQALQTLGVNKGQLDKGLADAAVAFDLARIGTTLADATTVVKGSRASGLSAAKGAGKFLEAEEVAGGAELQDIAKVAPAVQAFAEPGGKTDVNAGLAVAATLAESGLDLGKLEVFTRRAGTALFKESEAREKAVEAVGGEQAYRRMDTAERFALFGNLIQREQGSLSREAIGAFGISEVREQQALQFILQAFPQFQEKLKRITAAGGHTLEHGLETIMGDPRVEQEELRRKGAASRSLSQVVDPTLRRRANEDVLLGALAEQVSPLPPGFMTTEEGRLNTFAGAPLKASRFLTDTGLDAFTGGMGEKFQEMVHLQTVGTDISSKLDQVIENTGRTAEGVEDSSTPDRKAAQS